MLVRVHNHLSNRPLAVNADVDADPKTVHVKITGSTEVIKVILIAISGLGALGAHSCPAG